MQKARFVIFFLRPHSIVVQTQASFFAICVCATAHAQNGKDKSFAK
jgi:hypothetical protein